MRRILSDQEDRPTTNEELVKLYADAATRWDFDVMGKLRHADWSAVLPQSGEIVRGSDDDRRIAEGYPGGLPKVVTGRLVGSEDRWVTSPLGGAYRVSGDGENWWAEWRMIYPDGKNWFTVTLVELREGKVWRETTYWAEPIDAPEWRHHLVERPEAT